MEYVMPNNNVSTCGGYANPNYVDINEMKRYVDDQRKTICGNLGVQKPDINFNDRIEQPTIGCSNNVNDMCYGVNNQLLNSNYTQQQHLDPYTFMNLTPEAQQEFNYYMSHMNEINNASPKMQQLIRESIQGQQYGYQQQQQYYDPGCQYSYNQPQYQQYIDPYGGYYNNPYGQQPQYQQQQYDPYYGYYNNTIQQPQQIITGNRLQMSDYNNNPFLDNPINTQQYLYNNQEDQYQQMMDNQSHQNAVNIISRKVRNYLGVTDEQYQKQYEIDYAEQKRQYDKYMENQLQDHLAYLDNMINDDEYVYREDMVWGNNVAYNLEQAKREMPDDQPILETLKVLTQKNIELHDREAARARASRLYSSSAYNRELDRQLINNNTNPLLGCFRSQEGMSVTKDGNPVKNIGCFNLEQDLKSGSLNITVPDEYMKKREAFLKEVRIANDNTNKGQSIGGYIIKH